MSTLTEVLATHPGLTENGFDGADSKIRVDEFEAARAWLLSDQAPPRVKAIEAGSYGLKHLMERQGHPYVTNGAFIAAALSLGIPHKCIPGSLNADFALSTARKWWSS